MEANAVQIWKCPNCETLNDGEKCKVCGEKYIPVIKKTEAPEMDDHKSEAYLPHENNSKRSPLIAVITLLLIVLLLLLCVIIGYLAVMKKSRTSDSDYSQDTTTAMEVSTSDVNTGDEGKGYYPTVSPKGNKAENRETEKGVNPNIADQSKSTTLPQKRVPVNTPEGNHIGTAHVPDDSHDTQDLYGDNKTATYSVDMFTSPDGYYRYIDNECNYTCLFPSQFLDNVEKIDNGFYASSGDDGSDIHIECISSANKSAETEFENYVSGFGDGVLDYESVGKTFYAARMILNDNTYRYKYAKFLNGKIYSFELSFTSDVFEQYDVMINYIYNDFIKQFGG